MADKTIQLHDVKSGTDFNVAYTDNGDGTLSQSVNTEGRKATYSAGVLALLPATTATDVFTIKGSASKTIRVTRIEIHANTTAVGTIAVQALKRSAADTAGTPATVTVVPHDSTDPGASATVQSWTGNPSLGALVGILRAGRITVGANGELMPLPAWDFSTRNGRGIAVRGVAEQVAVNLNGAALIGGEALDVNIEWTEE